MLFSSKFTCSNLDAQQVGIFQHRLELLDALHVLKCLFLEPYAYRCVDVPVVQMTIHSFMFVVEIVELTVGIDEVAVPVVGDRKARGEVQRNAVVA